MKTTIRLSLIVTILLIVACAGKKQPSITLEPAKPRPYRFEQRYVEVMGVNISYIDEGPRDAPAILFIHGLGGALDNWDYNVAHFAGRFRCLAIDLPGFGNSDQSREFPYTISWNAEIVAAFLEKLGVTKATLVGNSMGGHTAAYVAIMYPEIVENLVLVDASGTFKATGIMKILVKYPDFVENYMMKQSNKRLAQGIDVFTQWMYETQLENPQGAGFYSLEPPEVQEFVKNMTELIRWFGQTEGYPHWVHAQIFLARSILMTPLNDRLHEITAPTLIWWGAEDRVVELKYGYIFQREIKNSFMIVMPECGHVGMIEKAKEFNAAIDRFLCRTP